MVQQIWGFQVSSDKAPLNVYKQNVRQGWKSLPESLMRQ